MVELFLILIQRARYVASHKRPLSNILNYASHVPIVGGVFAGILVVVMLPVRLPTAWRYSRTRLQRWAFRLQRHAHRVLMRIVHTKKALAPIAWVTRYKVLNRQFARLLT